MCGSSFRRQLYSMTARATWMQTFVAPACGSPSNPTARQLLIINQLQRPAYISIKNILSGARVPKPQDYKSLCCWHGYFYSSNLELIEIVFYSNSLIKPKTSGLKCSNYIKLFDLEAIQVVTRKMKIKQNNMTETHTTNVKKFHTYRDQKGWQPATHPITTMTSEFKLLSIP